MQNSYLRLKSNEQAKNFNSVLNDLEDAYRIINTIYSVRVIPKLEFPSPVTLIPTYPDLPMEDVYHRIPETDIRELYLNDSNKGRVAYFHGDIDRTFWQIMSVDHGKLLRNTILWALNEDPLVEVKGPWIIDVTIWRQEHSMTVHLVNFTNPMMMKGPFRELIPVDMEVNIKIPRGTKLTAVKLLVKGQKPKYEINSGMVTLSVSQISDHEIVALDLV